MQNRQRPMRSRHINGELAPITTNGAWLPLNLPNSLNNQPVPGSDWEGREDFSARDTLDGTLMFQQGQWAQEIHLHLFDGMELQQSSVEVRLPPGLTLGVLLQGELQFALDGQAFRIYAKQQQPVQFAYRLASHTLFRKTIIGGQQVRKVIITIPENSLAKLGPLPTPLKAHACPLQRLSPAKISELGEQILATATPAKSHPNIMQDALGLEFIAHCLRSLTCPAAVGQNQQALRIRQRLNALIQHSQEDLTLAELAQFFNMSVSKMQRLFKAEYQQTINDYIRQTRLEHAHYAMLEHNLSIGEAAYLAGYRHTSNFTAAYKKQFGVTPGSLVKTLEV